MYIQDKIVNFNLPTREQEETDTKGADSVYESATKWLREKTRDKKKFRLLFTDNINYGFARNLLGMKGVGLTTAVLTFILQTTSIYLEYSFRFKDVPPFVLVSMLLSLLLTYSGYSE